MVLESFAIRRDSGGTGKRRGGDGVVRRIRFRKPMQANILSGHRQVPPYGLHGGSVGATGSNSVEHVDGSTTQLAGTDRIELRAGDTFVIKTPGGGGYGRSDGN